MKISAVLVCWALAAAVSGGEPGTRVPVVLELFTSEGCSSCPPADRLLQVFDREQPIPGAELIVLSEHVDYWNHLGWSDPYSSPLFSERQRAYAGQLNAQVYTPQLVVDGGAELVGSDKDAAIRAIRETLRKPKLAVSLSGARGNSNTADIHVDIADGTKGDVYLILAADSAQSKVAAGENAGRSLSHVAVVNSIERLAANRRDVHLQLGQGVNRIVALIEDPATKRILGAAQIRL